MQALKVIEDVQSAYDDMIVTEVKMFEHFHKAKPITKTITIAIAKLVIVWQ